MDIKITRIPFDCRSYILYSSQDFPSVIIKDWLDKHAPESYVVTGENIITFLDPKAETMFILRWMRDN